MIGVLVSDEDSIEAVEVALNRGKPCQGFAFAQARVYKDAGTLRFEQRKIARTARSKYGNTQADGNSPRRKSKTCKIMAERWVRVNQEPRNFPQQNARSPDYLAILRAA